MHYQYRHKKSSKKTFLILVIGIIVGIILTTGGFRVMHITSTDEYCESCHIHPHATESWKRSTHFYNKSGVSVHCVDCHLPPAGTLAYYTEKTKVGLKDIWSYWTKDSAAIDWNGKKRLDHAYKIVYNESCKACHTNLFSDKLTDRGLIAHLYYSENDKKLDLQCIGCHLDVGHHNPNYKHDKLKGVPCQFNKVSTEIYTDSAVITEFKNFTEYVPGSNMKFNMKAIPGGSFKMGSPDDEPFRKSNEGPVREVTVSPFFMAEVETTWDLYWLFYAETMSEGRISPEVVKTKNAANPNIDGISGPTPPFGFPDQGWGGGSRPAITMTPYAAKTFCQWLSKKTGKNYRLPTEAEWEYAARGGKQRAYFFEGDPRTFSNLGFWRKIISADTTTISRYVVYAKNSLNKTQEPAFVAPNTYGLKNMLGNVLEYCSDYYSAEAYSKTGSKVTNPKGPDAGSEYVLRGGNYLSDASELRCASRFSTQNDAWLKTDPQHPKSIWWYSDITGIGFRIVCDNPLK